LAIYNRIVRKKKTTDDRAELALAAEVQRALLPQACPLNCPRFRAAARSRTCGNIGGDFHDFMRLNQRQVVVVIGDVIGHGVPAALVMSLILGFLRSERDSQPARIVSTLNRVLIALGKRLDSVLTCSLFYAVLDVSKGSALFVNAGHPRPYLCDRRAGVASLLGANDLLLGIQEYEAQETRHAFGRGERMVLYTDGITDARNNAANRWGRRRFEKTLRQHTAEEPDGLADRVFTEVNHFRQAGSQYDDETIVVIDRV
jgi:serine phosphatase RsbU (regulator of sigma subunit)